MIVSDKISEIRKQRWTDPNSSWGCVPTMGFLHEGHLSLVRRAREENDKVGVSIFVNPMQFNEPDDLTAYPRDLERDLELLKKENVDLVWTPTQEIMYPADFQTYIEVEKVSFPLEGAARPGHFRGVATVVAKIFNAFQPHRAYFGQKDAQQIAVIKQMVRDLNVNIEIVACPTVREPDGLAMSSRNSNLSQSGRGRALSLYQALTAVKEKYQSGERDAETLRTVVKNTLQNTDEVKIDYVSVADPTSLAELEKVKDRALISLAAFVDGVRLIDNIVLGESEGGTSA